MNDELKAVLQHAGDSICDLFEQMERGDWDDNMGHAISMNTAMLEMQTVLKNMMQFRAKHLGYPEVALKEEKTSDRYEDDRKPDQGKLAGTRRQHAPEGAGRVGTFP